MARDADYFNRICRVSRALGTTSKKQDLLDLIVGTAIETMNGKAAGLFLPDQEKDLFVPVAQKGLSAQYLQASPEKAGALVAGLLKEGHLSVRDATADERIEHHDAKKAEGIASILFVPVMVHDTIIGVLTLFTGEERTFTENELTFLKALAGLGGIAIDRARLIEHIRKNAKLFYDLSASINASLDIKHIMSALTVDLSHAFNAKGVCVLLLDKDHQTLTPVAIYGISETLLSKEALAADKAIADALTGETVVVKNISRSDRVFTPENHRKDGIAAVISAPIKSGQSINGVLRLYFSAPRDFYDDEIIMINAFAQQAGLAIRNSTCFLALENDYKDLKDDLWSHRSWF